MPCAPSKNAKSTTSPITMECSRSGAWSPEVLSTIRVITRSIPPTRARRPQNLEGFSHSGHKVSSPAGRRSKTRIREALYPALPDASAPHRPQTASAHGIHHRLQRNAFIACDGSTGLVLRGRAPCAVGKNERSLPRRHPRCLHRLDDRASRCAPFAGDECRWSSSRSR